MMKTRFSIAFSLALGLICSSSYAGLDPALTRFEVIPAFAPVGETSPNFSGYASNAIAYLMGTGSATSNRTSATDYELAPPTETNTEVSPREAMITGGFNSWRGYAEPTVGWDGNTGQFASESGNRVHFGLAIETIGPVKISLDDIGYQRYWLDTDTYGASSVVDNPIASGTLTGGGNPDYSASRVGLLYGGDGKLGGGDDVLVTAGSGSQLVDAIYYVGVGDGFVTKHPEASSNQEDIDLTLQDIYFDGTKTNPNQLLGVTYLLSLSGRDVSATSTVTFAVPEPATMGLGLMALVGLAGRLRRRTK